MKLNTILVGDALEKLAELPAGCVQMVVTSPPYWGLRDYGTATWEGGREDCNHRHPDERRQIRHGDGRKHDSYSEELHLIPGAGAAYKDTCGKCGALRIDKQIGLEATPEEFTDSMVAVFREVRRVLRDDGTLWLNLGDSYVTEPYGDGHTFDPKYGGRNRKRGYPNRSKPPRLKHKDLVGIPWRVAFALQADGWYLRSEIIWSKPNPMPEPVKDRPTKAHEQIFLLTKSPRYYYDAEAIRERGKNPADDLRRINADRTKRYSQEAQEQRITGAFTGPVMKEVSGRNRRTVWEVATKPYPQAHFATFPEKLIQPCILAGSKQSDVILDPFIGAGTVALVALKACRKFLGIELNPEYADLARRRIAQELNQEKLF